MTEWERRQTDTTDDGLRQRGAVTGPIPLAAFCRMMIGTSPIPTALVSGPEHVLRCVSPGFAWLLAAEVSALEGRPLRTALDHLDPVDLLAALDRAAATGAAVAVQEALRQHPQHGPIAWTYQISPLLDAHGQPSELFLEVQDATAHLMAAQVAADIRAINEQLILAQLRAQDAAEELARQLAFVQALTQSLSDGVYALDAAGRVSYVNPSAERMLGAPAAAILGRPAQEVIPVQGGPTQDALDAPFWAVLRTGVPHRDPEARIATPHGPPLPICAILDPIISGGAVIGVVGVLQDVSALLHLTQMREEYVTLLSHDLRSPLTTILGTADLLRRRLRRHDLLREVAQAETIIASSHRMDHLIQDLLDRSAFEAGTATSARHPIDLAAALDGARALLPTATDRQRVALECGDRVLILGDEAQITRVLVNLLSNALKYSPPDQAVTARLTQDGLQALVAVRDQGVGIDPEDVPRLFTKHYRARTAGAVPGTGLGLYSSQLMVAAHGGRMWVESLVGVGTTVFVALPLARYDAVTT